MIQVRYWYHKSLLLNFSHINCKMPFWNIRLTSNMDRLQFEDLLRVTNHWGQTNTHVYHWGRGGNVMNRLFEYRTYRLIVERRLWSRMMYLVCLFTGTRLLYISNEPTRCLGSGSWQVGSERAPLINVLTGFAHLSQWHSLSFSFLSIPHLPINWPIFCSSPTYAW